MQCSDKPKHPYIPIDHPVLFPLLLIKLHPAMSENCLAHELSFSTKPLFAMALTMLKF